MSGGILACDVRDNSSLSAHLHAQAGGLVAHHAGRALGLAVRRAAELGLDRVLLTCDDDNRPSARTIVAPRREVTSRMSRRRSASGVAVLSAVAVTVSVTSVLAFVSGDLARVW